MVLVDDGGGAVEELGEGLVEELGGELVGELVGGGVVAGAVVRGGVVVATVLDTLVVAGTTELVAGTASSPSEHDAIDSVDTDIAATSAAVRMPAPNDRDVITVVMSSSCAPPSAVPTDRGPDPPQRRRATISP